MISVQSVYLYYVQYSTFDGIDALTNGMMTWTTGNDVQQAMSFKLDPKFDMSGAEQAICVTDIPEADQLIRKEIAVDPQPITFFCHCA
jgi:hypothetical protein